MARASGRSLEAVVQAPWGATFLAFSLLQEADALNFANAGALRDLRLATYITLGDRNPAALHDLRKEIAQVTDPGVPAWVAEYMEKKGIPRGH